MPSLVTLSPFPASARIAADRPHVPSSEQLQTVADHIVGVGQSRQTARHSMQEAQMSVRMTLKLQGAAQHDEIRAIMRVPSPRPGPRPSNVILTDIPSPAATAHR